MTAETITDDLLNVAASTIADIECPVHHEKAVIEAGGPDIFLNCCCLEFKLTCFKRINLAYHNQRELHYWKELT